MTHPEMQPGSEPAQVADLYKLFTNSTDWLRKNGIYFYEPAYKVFGTHNGLPILEEQAYFKYKVSLEDLTELAPEAVKYFSVSGPVDLIYCEPSYAPLDYSDINKLIYQEPMLSFDISQPLDSHINELRLTIFITSDGELHTQRIEEPRDTIGPPPKATLRELLQAHIENIQLQDDVGYHNISIDEFNSLNQIIEAVNTIALRE